ncbi:hypothetical protein K491DRAFT_693920 [Lophiostoma macrostomum CBS 122681]|uniref:2EXR domain-containing protein n=1 Tax=Lophiostoma macrostomum CBS 122681 TaxID=1314788 RepID=A0A6A6T5C3_9PLEO|nr:hypothetical protein K491DRAFT_693920 [Lophiostoma macrostomum CBS 122681]
MSRKRDYLDYQDSDWDVIDLTMDEADNHKWQRTPREVIDLTLDDRSTRVRTSSFGASTFTSPSGSEPYQPGSLTTPDILSSLQTADQGHRNPSSLNLTRKQLPAELDLLDSEDSDDSIMLNNWKLPYMGGPTPEDIFGSMGITFESSKPAAVEAVKPVAIMKTNNWRPLSPIQNSRQPVRTFHPFMKLPRELRNRVYEEVLVSNNEIAPRLCNGNGNAVHFHDDNSWAHNSISNTLAITQVSKQLRDEALPIFYGSNTFVFGIDLATFFERLSQLNRFHMVRRVTFPVHMYHEEFMNRVLRDVLKNLTDQELFEQSLRERFPNFDWRDPRAAISALRMHPAHTGGGVPWIGLFLVLRRLSASLNHNATERLDRELVVRIPSETIFAEYKGLNWFREVLRDLRIKLKIVEGAPVHWLSSGFQFEWNQKYQHRHVDDQMLGFEDKEKIRDTLDRTYMSAMYRATPNPISYYRDACPNDDRSGIEWYRVDMTARPDIASLDVSMRTNVEQGDASMGESEDRPH